MNEEEKTTREKIIEKVKKLIALADGSSFEGEIDVAMRMARSLLAKYNLSMSDVERNEYDKSEPSQVDTGSPYGYWQPKLANIIGKYTNCQPFIRSRSHILCFVGMPPELEICIFTFSSVCHQIDSMTRKKRKELRDERERLTGNRQDRVNSSYYIRGYVEGILVRLKEKLSTLMQDESTGKSLVLVKHPKVQEWVDINLGKPKMRHRPSSSSDGFDSGYVDGNNITLQKGINGGRPTERIGH